LRFAQVLRFRRGADYIAQERDLTIDKIRAPRRWRW
jgi:hypothetical protein